MSLVACAAIVTFSFLRVDVPAALYFWSVDHLRSPLNTAFGSTVILSAEAAVILFTVFARLLRGHISVFGETGKILAALAVSQNESYFLRDYDVAAYQRLVYLAFQLKRQHIANADVASFMSTHPSWSTHPVGGRIFVGTHKAGSFPSTL